MRAPHTCTGCWSGRNESPLRIGREIPLVFTLETVFLGASMKVYTSRYRTNGPAVIRGMLICLIESPHKLLGIIFSDFRANVSVRP